MGLSSYIGRAFKKSFEKRCITLLVDAYNSSISNTDYQLIWDENDFSSMLEKYIEKNPRRVKWKISCTTEKHLHTDTVQNDKGYANKMMGEALNMRVGTRNLTISQATAEGARQGKTFEELVAMPEIDGWIYSDGPNYVCSCFVTAFYKAGGLFDGLSIQANEFTPKDVYSLNFFDKNYKRPQACIDADPELPYCQIMGKFKIDLPTYSSIDPYDHMNENCPSLGPDFVRPADC